MVWNGHTLMNGGVTLPVQIKKYTNIIAYEYG